MKFEISETASLWAVFGCQSAGRFDLDQVSDTTNAVVASITASDLLHGQ